MPRTKSSSSSPPSNPPGADRLVRISLDRLRPHPANANVMCEGRLEKLAENIRREGDYPPLVVRPHPEEEGCYQLLDGHQRADVVRRLGHEEAVCYVWPCDHRTALVLLATLNPLEGQDDPNRLYSEVRDCVYYHNCSLSGPFVRRNHGSRRPARVWSRSGKDGKDLRWRRVFAAIAARRSYSLPPI